MLVDLSLAALVAIAIGLLIGNMLFHRRGQQARGVSASVSVLTSLFWLTSGIFAILAGFHVIGIAIVAIMFYLLRGNYREATGGEGVRSRIAG